MISNRFIEFSGNVSGPIGVVCVLSIIVGGLLGLGGGSVIGWLSGYAAGVFRMWRG